MCLSIPAKILSIEKDEAVVSVNGAQTTISLLLVEGVCVEDYVLVHAGYAIQKLSEEEALYGIELIKKLNKNIMLSNGSPGSLS